MEELPLWHRWTELRNRIRFLVVGRGDGSLGENLPEGASFLLRNFHLPDLSSSAIREALASDRPVDSWLPGGVRQYLDEHPDLYGG